LMLALYRCGRQAEALEAYRDARRRMSEELGLEPGPELRELEARILAQSPELAAPAAPRRRMRRAPDEAAQAGAPRRRVAVAIVPAAVAAEADRVWVADGRRGLVLRFDAGYEAPSARISYPRARASGPAGLNVREPVSLATGGGAVWVTDGSRRLTRIDA